MRVVREMVADKEVAIAFSGGLDCGIITAMASGIARSINLYTVGTENCYDVSEAKKMARAFGINCEHILITEDDLIENVHEMIKVTNTVNPITISFEVPLFYVAKSAKEDYILTGQGADELFAGYSKYVGLSDVMISMKKDMEKLFSITLPHEKKVSEYFQKTVFYPYLDRRIIGIAEKMNVNDFMFGEIRKKGLREVAEDIGWPEIAMKRKKAAQYGSGTMSVLRKIAKRRNMTISEMIKGVSLSEY